MAYYNHYNDNIMIRLSKEGNMLQIRPVSDLRNKFTEIEKCVQKGDPVYLTKNGYGTMVVLSIESYSRLTEPEEYVMDVADMAAESTAERLSHYQVFNGLRRKINDENDL